MSTMRPGFHGLASLVLLFCLATPGPAHSRIECPNVPGRPQGVNCSWGFYCENLLRQLESLVPELISELNGIEQRVKILPADVLPIAFKSSAGKQFCGKDKSTVVIKVFDGRPRDTSDGACASTL